MFMNYECHFIVQEYTTECFSVYFHSYEVNLIKHQATYYADVKQTDLADYRPLCVKVNSS